MADGLQITEPDQDLELAEEESVGSVSQAFTAVTPGTRPSIHSYSATDRKALADAILEFITQPIIDEHTAGHTWHTSDERFFSGHHGFLNKLETFLANTGRSRFIPVPSWDPGTPIPAEFMVLDPLVANRGALNQNPNRPIPARLRNPCIEPYATANDLAFATNPPDNSSWHNSVHLAVGGAMGQLPYAPGAPIFWLWHGLLDDIYHTYQSCTTPRSDVTAEITPATGSFGSWGITSYCPAGQYAIGYRMRVEPNQGSGDDTSLNAVELQCRAPNGSASWSIASHGGFWGAWTSSASCRNANSQAPTNFLDGARLRTESSQGSGDDTGANDATFTCGQGDVINPGGGRGIGTWSSYASCPADSAVCGITARTEGRQGSGDDTAMNGVRLKCCRVQPQVASCTTPISEPWTDTLGSEGSGWTGAWGDATVETANRRLRLSHDDVVARRAALPGSYYVVSKLTLSGGTVFTPYPVVDGTHLLASIRRSGNDMQLGGARYGAESWSNTQPAGFAGRLLTGLLTAKVTSYVQATSKRMAMKVEAGGVTYRSGWTGPFTSSSTNLSLFRFVGENNSVVYNGTDDYVYVGPVGGCANLTDSNVEAMYNQ